MNEELLLAMKNAEYNNEQRRLLRNQRSRRQTTVNLINGLLPYFISKDEALTNSDLSNHELSSSSEPVHAYNRNDDIDFGLVSTEDLISNNESDDSQNYQAELDDSMVLLDELFSTKTEQDFLPLHSYTNISINEFCTNLIRTFREANLCKTYSSDILKLIHLALPQPNGLPTSINSILKFIQVEDLFIKRKVCLLCQYDMYYTATSCNRCKSSDNTQVANIYDTDYERVFADIVERHLIDIIKYREKILRDETDDINNDIPFQKIYRSFLKTNLRHPFISTLIHLDGIGLGKSNKLTLWLLSCSILELPPHIRSQRKNMIIISMWIATRQPVIQVWLRECIKNLNQLKSTGFSINGGQRWFLYFIGMIADCPAMKLALNHIGNNGYFSCWLCKIKGVHIDKKRQYYFEEVPKVRSINSYINESKDAEINGENVNGHLGLSVFHDLLDVPLPKSIIIDYMHVSLLRHTRSVVLQIYETIKPKKRLEIDDKLRSQCFPHTFNRKLKPVSAGYPKATEIRNLLLYALLPLFFSYLPVDKGAHIALFVCAIRLLHGRNYFGDRTSILANQLISIYYKDHHKYYDGLENLVLHLHIHYASQYKNFGSLNNTNCFGQESLLGSFAKNKHGTRYWGDLLAHYFNIDFALQKQNNQQNVGNVKRIDGAFDMSTISMNNVKEISSWHEHICGCNQTITCIIIYYRCIIRSQMYHSINYPKRQSTNSYFVQYNKDNHNSLFGSIIYFFTHKGFTFALIHNYSNLKLFSDMFALSTYHSLLLNCINSYFYMLQGNGSSFHYVPIEKILNICVVFQKDNCIIVTPISEAYEHD